MSGNIDTIKNRLHNQHTTSALLCFCTIMAIVILTSPGSVAQAPNTGDIANITPSPPFTPQLHNLPESEREDRASPHRQLLPDLEHPPGATHLSVKELLPRRLRAGSTGEFILHGKGFTNHTDVELAKPNPYVAISNVQFVDSDTLKVTITASEKARTRVFNFMVEDPRSGRDKLAPGLIVVHVPPTQ